MATGEYSHRVRVRTKDEVGRLATAFNEMAAALEQDVGELRRQEALRRELAANVSHDLATPLTAIQGFTEALLDGVIEDERQREETLRVIAKEVVRLRRLVDDLGHLSRVESPSLLLELAPLNLATLVDETLAVLQPELEAKSVRAQNLIDAETPLALADTDKLTQVLLNLLDNALRYTPSGREITISAAVETGRVRVVVQDTGAGIATEHIKRIFDRFYRADVSRNVATGGSGLGLAIVKAIIEAHGGSVGIDSAPGKGTSVWFTLAQVQ
jgi:signal transduction histidine kinase